MKTQRLSTFLGASLVAALAATFTPAAHAQSLSISSYTIDCGGGTSTSALLSLTGTIGQPDAGVALASPNLYVLGGFWGATSGPLPGCVADFDDGSGTGTRDGGVTLDDLLYYIDLYANGSVAADIDDGSGTGTRDGGVTLEDLLFFLLHFDAGC
jgi:hypothetical protein